MSKPQLAYDPALSGVQNALNLVHHTYPELTDTLVTETTEFESIGFDSHPLYNSQLKVTSTAAELEGITVYPYNRIDVTRPDVIVPAESTVAAYLVANPLPNYLAGTAVSAEIHTVAPVAGSLTHTGSYTIRLAGADDVPAPASFADTLPVTDLDGLYAPNDF